MSVSENEKYKVVYGDTNSRIITSSNIGLTLEYLKSRMYEQNEDSEDSEDDELPDLEWEK